MSDRLARIMGYDRAVMFPRARDALVAYRRITGKTHPIPANVCPALAEAMPGPMVPVSETNGLALNVPVQLYGYRQIVNGAELEIDPLMTGCMGKPFAKHSVVSFGYGKTIDLGAGGAFLTNDLGLANELQNHAWFPMVLVEPLEKALNNLFDNIQRRFDRLAMWDRTLADWFERPQERQVIPWRVIRLSDSREEVVKSWRNERRAVGTNYRSLMPSSDRWGSRVLNFFLEDGPYP